MGMAGTPFPYYLSFLEPASAFSLAYAVNSIAMPLIGGMTTWIGPLIGAVLLGTLQQVHGDDLLGVEPADRRRAAGRSSSSRPERHRGPVAGRGNACR